MTLAERLKNLRTKRGYTFEEVATKASEAGHQMTKAVVWNVETQHRFPEPSTLRAMLAGLGVKEQTKEHKAFLDQYVREFVQGAFPDLVIPSDVVGKTQDSSSKQFRDLVADLQPDELRELILALSRPEVRAMLAPLNRLFEVKRNR